MNGNGNYASLIEPPLKCWVCGLTREQVLEQYGGFIVLPTAISSIATFICPQCKTYMANDNALELTKTLIAKQQNEPKIIRVSDPKVVQLTPKFK
jgi:hypothetical protein